MKKNIGSGVFNIINYTFMVLFSVSILYPFWNIILISFKTAEESGSLELQLWNRKWVLDAYNYIINNNSIVIAYGNTIMRTVLGVVIVVITSLLAAYPLSRRDLPGRNIFTIIFVIPMFFSGGMIPTYFIIRQLGLIDNRLVYVLPGAVAIFYVLLVRNFLMSLDKGLEESALLDGAGYLTILFQIIAPLSKPIIATIALWTAVGHWNQWVDSLLYINDDNKVVLQLIIQKMLKESYKMHDDIALASLLNKDFGNISAANVRAAAVIITTGPIILVYPFVQKHFVKGIMVGSLKG